MDPTTTEALTMLAERIDEVEATQRRIVDMLARLADILARTIDTETGDHP